MKCSMKKADSRQKGRTKGEETPISVAVKSEKRTDDRRKRLDGYIYVQILARKCVTAKRGTNKGKWNEANNTSHPCSAA